MSEEEKKAMEIVEFYLKNSAINSKDRNFFKDGGWETVDLEIPKAMQTIINLFKKQQKELKENKFFKKTIKENYIRKDKIEEKIENLTISLNDIENSLDMTANKYDNIKELNIKIDVLEELLED